MYTGVFTMYTGFHLLPTMSSRIKNLATDPITKRCIRKRCKITRWFTSHSRICDTVISPKRYGRNAKNRRFFIRFSQRFDRFLSAQIGEQVNQRIVLYIFCTHHFVIWSVAKFLMRNNIVGSRRKPVYIVKTPVYPPHHFPLTGDEATIDGDNYWPKGLRVEREPYSYSQLCRSGTEYWHFVKAHRCCFGAAATALRATYNGTVNT